MQKISQLHHGDNLFFEKKNKISPEFITKEGYIFIHHLFS